MVVTTDGFRDIQQLTVNDSVFALDLSTGLVKPKQVVDVSSVSTPENLVAIETQRADLWVRPDQRIPYCTDAISTPRTCRASALDDQAYYKFVNEWACRPGAGPETIDVTDLCTAHDVTFEACATTDDHGHTFRAALPDGCEPCRRNSHVGYYFDADTFTRHQSTIEAVADTVTIHGAPGHRRRPYRFDAIDFVCLLGWFVTEGSVYRSADRDTISVKLAQETDEHRRSITALLDRMGIDYSVDDRCVRFGSRLYGELLATLCGDTSREKHLPELVWDLGVNQRRRLLEILLAGDGNDRNTFYTASKALASDVCRLCVECGLKPRYTRRTDSGIWQVYVRWVNDGFNSTDHVRRVAPGADTDCYRLTVSDYSAVLAGRNGKFQWVGVSRVA
jgi:DNA polymerase I